MQFLYFLSSKCFFYSVISPGMEETLELASIGYYRCFSVNWTLLRCTCSGINTPSVILPLSLGLPTDGKAGAGLSTQQRVASCTSASSGCSVGSLVSSPDVASSLPSIWNISASTLVLNICLYLCLPTLLLFWTPSYGHQLPGLFITNTSVQCSSEGIFQRLWKSNSCFNYLAIYQGHHITIDQRWLYDQNQNKQTKTLHSLLPEFQRVMGPNWTLSRIHALKAYLTNDVLSYLL